MKGQSSLLLVIMLCVAGACHALGGHDDEFVSAVKYLFEPESHSNMAFVKHSGSAFANLITNKSLLSQQEERFVFKVLATYTNITTNFVPAGAVRTGMEQQASGLWTGHFQYAASGAREDIRFGDIHSKMSFKTGGGYDAFMGGDGGDTAARFRAKNGDGYDVVLGPPEAGLSGGSEVFIAQIRHGIPNGLFVDIRGDHVEQLVHLVDGKAFGKWFMSDDRNHVIYEIRVKAPVDYFKYMTQEMKN